MSFREARAKFELCARNQKDNVYSSPQGVQRDSHIDKVYHQNKNGHMEILPLGGLGSFDSLVKVRVSIVR